MLFNELINEIKNDYSRDCFIIELYQKCGCIARIKTGTQTLLQTLNEIPAQYKAHFYVEYNKSYGSDRIEIEYIQCMSKNEFDEYCYFICRDNEKISIL